MTVINGSQMPAQPRPELPAIGSREHTEAKAFYLQGMREKEATTSVLAGSYCLMCHDMAANTATIRRKENAERTYSVNYLTGVCTCRDYTDRLKPLNEQLSAMGSDKRVQCKHISVAWSLAFVDAGKATYADFMDADPLFTDAEMDLAFRADWEEAESVQGFGKVAA